MTYVHLFEAAEKLTEMKWPDTVTDTEALKIIKSAFGPDHKPCSDNLFMLRALTASRYRAEIRRLLDSDQLSFYDPLTHLKIGCNDVSDPLVELEELQELLNKLEPIAPQKDKSAARSASSVPNYQHWTDIAREIADECFDNDTKNECRDSLKGYSKRVMDIMQKRHIKGSRGIFDEPGTIQREALQAEKWWANKQK